MRPPLADSDPDPASWRGLLADLVRVVFVLLLGVAVFVNVTIGWPL